MRVLYVFLVVFVAVAAFMIGRIFPDSREAMASVYYQATKDDYMWVSPTVTESCGYEEGSMFNPMATIEVHAGRLRDVYLGQFDLLVEGVELPDDWQEMRMVKGVRPVASANSVEILANGAFVVTFTSGFSIASDSYGERLELQGPFDRVDMAGMRLTILECAWGFIRHVDRTPEPIHNISLIVAPS